MLATAPPLQVSQTRLNFGCRFEAIRSIARFVFGKHAKANAQRLPTALLHILLRVVDTDSDTDNRTCAMNCLNNIAVDCPSFVLAGNDALACALRVVEEQGTGAAPSFPSLLVLQPFVKSASVPHTHPPSPSPTSDMAAWAMSSKFGFTLMSKAVEFLQSASQSTVGTHMLRVLDVQSALLPISSLPGSDEQHTANGALFCLINVMGNQEAHCKGQDSPIMLLRPDVVGIGNAARACLGRCDAVLLTPLAAAVLADFENVLDASKRHLSNSMLSPIVRACLVLSESDSNKPHLRSSNLLRLTADALRLYACNAPSLTVVRSDGCLRDAGGGGSDPECAQVCVELLLQLSFCFPQEREWRSAVEHQCPDLNQLLLVLKDLPPSRSLDMHTTLTLKHLLTSLEHAAPSQVASVSSAPAACLKQHAMLSYCWGAKKELVVELAASLRAKGVDVWRDEEGSQCVPAMSGSTDDCMAAAIEHSHTIVVCVSRAYKASANCRMEAKYANDMHKRGKVQLVFVMMEREYTTRSSPEYVDGWLGLMISDQLWHGMWAGDQVAAVAAAIHAAVAPGSLAVASAAVTSTAAVFAAAQPRLVAAPAVGADPCSPPAALRPVQPSHTLPMPSPAAPSLKRPADPQTPVAKSARVQPPASHVAASPAAAAVHAASPCSQPLTPSLSQAQSPLACAGGDDDSAAALAAAFECLQDANKARDSSALAALLQSLGVTCAADLAYIDDASKVSINQLLKPAAANFFTVAIGASAIKQSFFYLQDATKHVDPAAMSALLQQLGISQPRELQYLDDSQLRGIVALLKPVAGKVFVHMMELVRRGR